MMNLYPRAITILEGPDGGGKSTLASRFVESGAHLVHLDRFPGVKNLARLHFEAMLPALLGHQDVVLDRAWMTEKIYGEVYRNGANRIDDVLARMLERAAARCYTRVILCLPPLETCLETFRGRREQEYLKDEEALRQVWQSYELRYSAGELTSLPVTLYDRTNLPGYYRGPPDWDETEGHPIGPLSAGCWDAEVVLVVGAPPEHTDAEPLLQLPSVQFGPGGGCYWLTQMLETAGINERELLWVSANDPCLGQVLTSAERRAVIALGGDAARRLSEMGQTATAVVEHPRHAEEFCRVEPYALIAHLKEALA